MSLDNRDYNRCIENSNRLLRNIQQMSMPNMVNGIDTTIEWLSSAKAEIENAIKILNAVNRGRNNTFKLKDFGITDKKFRVR
jgi:hypothetical protein